MSHAEGASLEPGSKLMKRLTSAGLGIVVALILGTSVNAQSLKQQLVGSWILVSSDTTPPTGAKRQDFGATPKGILILDAGGRYALVQGQINRPKFKDTNNLRLGASDTEFAAAARPFAANFGTWSVNEADKTLIRKYEIALIPNNDSLESKASVSLSGDELKLATTSPAGVKSDTVYRRAK
jgi:hypothetical protein